MKKNGIIIGATVVVAVVIVALIAFVISGKHDDSSDAFELDGVWKVATNVNEGGVSIPKNEYMVFKEGEVADYRDGSTEPYVVSSYKISEDVLNLPDVSRTFHLAKKSEECIALYTNDETYITIVKAENEDVLVDDFDTSTIAGKWNVDYRPSEMPIDNEYLVFNDKVLSDYRDNSENPSVEANYEWEGNTIKVPELGMEMLCERVASDRIILIDVKDGNVWLLNKGEE